MSDFLLELLSEEIPARMQAKAQADLARLFAEQLSAAGLRSQGVETCATPRRLVLIARGLPEQTEPVREELKGPRASAPPQALEGFLRKTGLTRDQLEERDGIFYAVSERPGRTTSSVLAEAIPAIVRAFPWPKSMRWGPSSFSNESLRWVRPLQGIVALLGEEIVDFEIGAVRAGAATVGHRFHHPGIITIGSANDYAEKLRACHVIVDPAERQRIIREGAEQLAAEAGLKLVPDEGLVAENAGLTEWPVPLLGSFDPAFLEVPREVIQLTMRTNQKYFACVDGEGRLAPNFICTANIEAADGGTAIVQGNERVLSARLSDAKFFWEQDLNIPLEEQAKKLSQIVFHEKLGTVADKTDRVAKLARWLVEEGIVKPSPLQGRGLGEGQSERAPASLDTPVLPLSPTLSPEGEREALANLAETAARLCKADLVTAMVGEFPELQGIIGGHLARAQGLPDEVADAIRDHYKPVGQGDEVPTAPVTVAVSLGDKLDTLFMMFGAWSRPTGSKDPYALRRAALGVVALVATSGIRVSLSEVFEQLYRSFALRTRRYKEILERDDVIEGSRTITAVPIWWEEVEGIADGKVTDLFVYHEVDFDNPRWRAFSLGFEEDSDWAGDKNVPFEIPTEDAGRIYNTFAPFDRTAMDLLDFFADRLKVQQREAGVRHDLIDAVFALGGEDDLVRLLARVKALQSFVETPEGADLLAGYKRAANILKKEGWNSPAPLAGEGGSRSETGEGPAASAAEKLTPSPSHSAGAERAPPSPEMGEGKNSLSYTPLPEEAQLIAALDSAEPRARAAVEAEDFEGAMAALASLRAPVDAFFDKVTVNDPDPSKREARLDLLARMRDAVHQVADFSRIEG